MPKDVDELIGVLDLEEIEETLFRGYSPQVTTFQRAFGGQVLAQALTAAGRTVPDDRHVHSMNAYFLHGGRVDRPLIYDVERTRDGGSFTSRRVVARQGGRAIFSLSASFHIDEPGVDHMDRMPHVPSPEKCPPVSQVLEQTSGRSAAAWEAEWGTLDLRFAGDSGASGRIPAESHKAHMRVWARTSGSLPDNRALHRAVLAYASDLSLLSVSTVPHRVAFGTSEVQAASIDHAMWFHRDIRADDWWLYDMISPSASHARGFSIGRVYQDGALVATAAQEGLIRVRPELLAERGELGTQA